MRHWWWEGMYSDTREHCKNCPQCAIVSGTTVGKLRPPLRPIPVQRAFQIVGVDIMDLPVTEKGNKHVVFFQDFLTKWPMVYPIPNQQTIHLVRLFAEQIVPMFGVPEALLSDRGANLLSHLMLDCLSCWGLTSLIPPRTILNVMIWIQDGTVERFNRTLKTMIRKHVDRFGVQWDQYLPGLLWAYRNTPHESTGRSLHFCYLAWIVDHQRKRPCYLQPGSSRLKCQTTGKS